MTTLSRTTSTVSPKYTCREFQVFVEDHLDYLIKQSTFTSIGDNRTLKFRNNFYGLLRDMGVASKYWWVYLRVNGYHSPLDYDGALSIREVPTTILDKLYQQQRTTTGELF